KFGVRINDIKRWNSLKSTRLSIGQRLYIYPRKVSFLFIKQQENKLYKLTATVLCDRNKIQKRDLNSNIS
ncbi:MAG: LysM peptidoglycan-binding domain-containing protein, partial [Polaribacter sp.]|nr:LysM peptidoglycan-binding domain-containing protein [Polaribacter sp.]